MHLPQPLRTRACLIAASVLLLASGCSNDNSGNPSLGNVGDGKSSLSDATAIGDAPVAADGAPIGDTVAQVTVKTNIGKVCASNADCALLGLKCFETNAATGAGICSKECKASSECDQGTFCNPQADKLICTVPRFCNSCKANADCAADGMCLTGAKGTQFCTKKCAFGDNSCPPAANCKQFGSSLDDFACQPDYGTCNGDGTQCSPCSGPGDCSAGTECYYASTTGERFCAKACKVGVSGGCPAGFGCTQPKGAMQAYCFKQVGEGTIATCAKSDKGFCEPCAADYECLSGRCALKNGKKFCVEPVPCTANKDCPHGGEATACVPSDNGKGTICAPPLSWGCQGYLACLGLNCEPGEKCVAGLCKKSP